MTTPTPPRPQPDHEAVKTAAVEAVLESLHAWGKSMSVIDDEYTDQEFTQHLTLAVIETDNAYQACSYLEAFCEWPIDMELVFMLNSVFTLCARKAREMTPDWVMQYKVRWTAGVEKRVKFKCGDAELVGEVIDVISTEARAIVTVPGGNGVMAVNAEDVIAVLPAKKKTPKPGGSLA